MIETVDIYELLEWYESLIRCSQYCPCECHHRDNIPDEISKDSIRNELVRRCHD